MQDFTPGRPHATQVLRQLSSLLPFKSWYFKANRVSAGLQDIRFRHSRSLDRPLFIQLSKWLNSPTTQHVKDLVQREVKFSGNEIQLSTLGHLICSTSCTVTLE